MKHLFLLFFFVSAGALFAQTGVGLVAYYNFEQNITDVTGNSANAGLPVGAVVYGCGISGDALQLGGGNQEVRFPGPVTQEFDNEDFTVSLYFKANGTAGTQYLVSKRSSTCTIDSSFYIRYVPRTRTLNVLLSESQTKSISLVENLEADACWYQVTVVRQNMRVRLYVNGQLRQEATTPSRINVKNNGALVLGGGDCLTANESHFVGLIDDFRVYYRALNELESRELYVAPDVILNRDTLVYLGGFVQIRVSNTCANSFSWSPAEGVAPPVSAEPVITPTKAGAQIYKLSFYDNSSACVATDTIRINVIDPTSLDCGTVYLPKAFTPNNDGLNETYGISNPYAIPEMISFEIFDRWGGRVFFTTDPFGRWDGFYRGEAVNPGVLLYRVRYKCDGVERNAAGSVTILR